MAKLLLAWGDAGSGMAKKDSQRYDIDPGDGMRRERVHDWCAEKHIRLRHYVDITWATRRKFPKAGAAYIDLYCGPGLAVVTETGAVLDGSAVVAATEAAQRCPFTAVHVSDLESENVIACAERLASRSVTNVHSWCGSAEEIAPKVAAMVHPHGLHLAFLDPYSLQSLPFRVIRDLAVLEKIDFIIHFSQMDYQRNLRSMMDNGRLDEIAPGWSRSVNRNARDDIVRQAVFEHWKSCFRGLGFHVSERVERVADGANRGLYWLVFASRHKLAEKFWGEVSDATPQSRWDF